MTSSGDDTVPYVSASMSGKIGTTAHLVTFSEGEITKGHGDQMTAPDIISAILNILAGRPAKSNTVLSQAASPTPYIQIVIRGLAEVDITESSNRYLGVGEDGFVVNQIPGATFDLLPNQVIVALPWNQTYRLGFKETSIYPVEMHIAHLQAPSIEASYTPAQMAVFVDIPSGKDWLASMSLDYTAEFESLNLSIDQDGDGLPEQSILPTSILDSQQSQDISMPDTTI